MSGMIVSIKPEIYEKVEQIASECSLDVIGAMGAMQRTFRMAAGIRLLREAITQSMLAELMSLQGSALGFKTDKEYPPDVVKECAIQCLLRGGYWVGNEFNIIAGNTYMTKEFFQRKNREFHGLTDLILNNGVPQLVGDKGALVPYVASWKLNGRPDRMECLVKKLEGGIELDERICVRVNSGMGADAILGKAERKMRAKIHARLTGSNAWDGEVEEGDAKKPAQNLNDLADRLDGKADKQDTADTIEQFEADAKAAFAACRTPTDVMDVASVWRSKANSDSEREIIQSLAEAQKAAIVAKRSSKQPAGAT